MPKSAASYPTNLCTLPCSPATRDELGYQCIEGACSLAMRLIVTGKVQRHKAHWGKAQRGEQVQRGKAWRGKQVQRSKAQRCHRWTALYHICMLITTLLFTLFLAYLIALHMEYHWDHFCHFVITSLPCAPRTMTCIIS